MDTYVGNGAYCYANSTAMLLASIGERVSPSYIEALTGVGFGAVWDEAEKVAWFNGKLTPDEGIDHALKLLGFTAAGNSPSADERTSIELLKEEIWKGPVILGPLDMGMLTYHPNHLHLSGCDHYIVAYAMDEQYLYLHDPAGFPHVRLPIQSLSEAWKAEKVRWKCSKPYQMWARPERINSPSEYETAQNAVNYYKTLYVETIEWAAQNNKTVNAEAIRTFSHFVGQKDVTPGGVGNMKYFLFQLGARRAMDTADFLKNYEPALTKIKAQQAQIFGACHTLAVQEDWSSLSKALSGLAILEEQMIEKLLTK